ncbi:ADP-ribosylglycohydrolase [Ceratobasidium theobromae]|uniref:ADP-ribosylglycohydrolase n=1 Tax=Ceratobasidium theobromae TaxID=1582974 RepID=A0A5N5QQ92_9AGAM|nr:ADP-ribosylglycohydrolase [Ceratobasidium theobromae]
MQAANSILGAVLGGALGDAIGLFTEFLPRSRAIELYGPSPAFSLEDPLPESHLPSLVGISPDRHRSAFDPSGWTDDTDQSILILLSFLASGGTQLDARDFALRLKFWVTNGLRCLDRLPLGLGRTMGNVVRDEQFEEDPVGTAVRYWEATNRYVAANGAVMRTAIIGALIFQDANGKNGIDRAMDAAVQIATTTHPDPRCLVSCTIITGLMAAIMRNELNNLTDFNQIVQRGVDFVQNYKFDPSRPGAHISTPLNQDQLDELHKYLYAKSLEDMKLDDRQHIGYTYKCLGAGVWALRKALDTPQPGHSGLFEECITEITMQGGDGDTNATVAGSLLGAYLTDTALPEHWVQHLCHGTWLAEKTRCATALLGLGGTYNPVDDPDVLIDGGKGAFTPDELNKRFDELMCEVGKRVYSDSALPGFVTRPGAKNKEDKGCLIC